VHDRLYDMSARAFSDDELKSIASAAHLKCRRRDGSRPRPQISARLIEQDTPARGRREGKPARPHFSFIKRTSPPGRAKRSRNSQDIIDEALTEARAPSSPREHPPASVYDELQKGPAQGPSPSRETASSRMRPRPAPWKGGKAAQGS